MRRVDPAALANDPKTKVDRILSDLIGKDFDLLTDKGREQAVEAIGSRKTGKDEPVKPVDTAEVPDGDTRSAWEAARGMCATVQIEAALVRLDKLKPLPDEDGDPMDGEAPADFASARRQVREQLVGLRDEYSAENDREVLENIHRTLFGGDRPLFDRLQEAGNYVSAHVNDRTDERQVIHFTAIRGFAAQLCRFGLGCEEPTTEPGGQSRIGKGLGATERALRCVRDTGERLTDELEMLGLSGDCTPETIPGLPFCLPEPEDAPEKPVASEAYPVKGRKGPKGGKGDEVGEPENDPACARALFTMLRRVDTEVGDWLTHIDRDGKRGVHLIRSEIDRLATKAQRFKPEPPKKGQEVPKVARLVGLFTSELDRASKEIARLLDA